MLWLITDGCTEWILCVKWDIVVREESVCSCQTDKYANIMEGGGIVECLRTPRML